MSILGTSTERIAPANYQGKLVELEGLRGVAILLVTLHHFWPKSGGLYEAISPLAHLGWIGVDLFFVISGLLIGGILLDTRSSPGYFRNFYARRVLRIFPLYYAFVCLLFIVVPLGQSMLHKVTYMQTEFIRESGSPLWYLLFAGNIRESITGVEPAYFLAPLWSISIEEQFYLMSPLLIRHLSPKMLKRVLVGLILFSPVFRLVMVELVPDNERIQYLATLSRFDNLSVGVLLALMLRTEALPDRRTTGILLTVSGLALAAAFLTGGLDRNGWFCRVFGYSLLAGFFAVLVYWAIQNRDTRFTSVLRTRWLVYLGGLCYGLYLLQRPAEVLLLKTLAFAGIAPEQYPTLSLFGKVGFSVLIAHASWHMFEKPINGLKKRFHSARHPLDEHIRANSFTSVPARER